MQADNDFSGDQVYHPKAPLMICTQRVFSFLFFIQGLPGTNGLPGGVGPQGPAVSNCHATLRFQENQHVLLSPVLLA